MDGKKAWKQLWLAYGKKKELGNGKYFENVWLKGFDAEDRVVNSALQELKLGAEGMLGVTPQLGAEAMLCMEKSEKLSPESYSVQENGGKLQILAGDEKGLLYGVFHVLRQVSMEKSLIGISATCTPDNPLRTYNHWDNMDGSIERGYSGKSFFFENDDIVINDRTRDYARLMASIGINGVVINNVNVKQAATWLITDRFFEKVAQLSEVFAKHSFIFSFHHAITRSSKGSALSMPPSSIVAA